MVLCCRSDSVKNDNRCVRSALHKAYTMDPLCLADYRETFMDDGECAVIGSSRDTRIKVDGRELENGHFREIKEANERWCTRVVR